MSTRQVWLDSPIIAQNLNFEGLPETFSTKKNFSEGFRSASVKFEMFDFETIRQSLWECISHKWITSNSNAKILK